jgi:hypothetical protein
MKIRRKAGQRFHKWTQLFDGPIEKPHMGIANEQQARVKWDDSQLALVIDAWYAPHQSDPERTYDFQIILDLSDISEILDCTSDEGLGKSAKIIGHALGPLAINLLRLVVVANGMETTQPSVSDDENA